MLNVFLGMRTESIHYVSDYFDAVYEPSWLNNDFSERVIAAVDKSRHIKDDYIEDYLGIGMSAKGLSTGSKGLILLYNEPKLEICGERFGDNCFPFLFELAQTGDIHITLSHIPALTEPFCMKITNSDITVHTMEEFAGEVDKCREAGTITYDTDIS